MKTKFKGILTLFLAFIVHTSFAQDRTVTGTVSDSTGGLPGVGVVIKGTTQGVETDIEGKYSIKTKTGATLVFSYVGMKTAEKVVGSSSTINVLMDEDANVLEEVVVTALGIKREKKSLGFAQQSVKGEQLTQTKEVDVNNAIAGKVAGVQLLGAPSSGFANAVIRLRGESDLLYVVDGVKIESSSDINTDDIEDLSVLKGSGATALYGPIGKNGVVIITTKKAKKGKTSFVFDQSIQVSNVYILPEYQNEYGGGYTQTFSTLNGQNIPNYAADESWGPRLDGTLVRHWDSWIPGSSTYGELRPWSPNPDNVKDFYETGVTMNTSFAFSKGGEDYSIKTVLRNVDIEGLMPNSKRNLQQISVGANYDISEQVEVYTNMNYQHRKTLNNPTEGYGNVASNFNQWFQRQVDMDRLRNHYNQNGQFYTWNIRSTTDVSPQYWDSPFFETDQNLKHQTKNATYGNLGINYKPNDNFTLNVEARRAVNSYKSDARVAFGGLNQTSFTQRDDTRTSTEFFGALTYNTDLTEDLDVTATVGSELRQWQRRYIDGATSGGLTIPGIYTVASSKDRPVYTNREWNEKNRAVFATASFGYKDMLYLDGSIRSDWNSNANKENNRVITKGGSLSFLFHKVLDFDALSFGKIRAGFAEAPSFPGVNELEQTYNTGGSFNGTIPFYPTANQANNLLEGGVREELELGAELQFFRNRLGLDFTYFDRKDNNLPIQVPLTGATGYTSSSINSGRLSSNGIEVALSGTPIRNDNFTWNVGLNFATLKRTVDELYVDPVTGEEITTDVLDRSWRGLTLEARVGEEWGAIYGRKITRDANGNQLLDSNGRIQFEQNQYLGNLLPDFTGGLTNSFTYKNFTLSANIDFQKGGKYFSVTKMFNNYSGIGIETVGNNDLGNPVRDAVADGGGVLVEGVDATSGAPVSYHIAASTYWPRLFALHERWIYDASYVKLRQMSLGYTLGSDKFKNTPIEDITLNVFANNLWLIYSDVKGVDPSEIENGTSGGYRWEEGGQAPSARTFGMNIKIRF